MTRTKKRPETVMWVMRQTEHGKNDLDLAIALPIHAPGTLHDRR